MLAKIIEKTEKNINFPDFTKIYIGFSGGADSTALVVLLKELSIKYRFCVIAVHFEHGLRDVNSLEDAAWCRKFCKNKQIDYLEFSIDVRGELKPGEGIESCARRLRLKKWSELVFDSTTAVALGHHEDDKLENLLLRLMRGSNSSGLTSLRHIIEVAGVTILRPLLDLSKNDLECFLKGRNINDWRIDSSNLENKYRRNIIRNKILAELDCLIPPARKGMIAAYEALNKDADYLEKTALASYKNILDNLNISSETQNNSSISLPVIYLKNLHPAIRARVLRYWFHDILGFDFIPNRDLLTRIEYELNRTSDEIVLIPFYKDSFLKVDKELLLLHAHNENISKSSIWDWKSIPSVEFGDYLIQVKIIECDSMNKNYESGIYFDYNKLPGTLIIRTWKNGDRFIPFGGQRTVRVKKIFKGEKVPVDIRKQIPILCTNSTEIIWICGVRRSNYAVIDNQTKKVAFFSINKRN